MRQITMMVTICRHHSLEFKCHQMILVQTFIQNFFLVRSLSVYIKTVLLLLVFVYIIIINNNIHNNVYGAVIMT